MVQCWIQSTVWLQPQLLYSAAFLVYLKNQPNSDKSNKIFRKNIKNKGNAALDSVLDFAEVSSYLTFKLYAWKRACTIEFELHIPPTDFIEHILESSYEVLLNESRNCNPSTACLIFTGCLIFRLFLLLKCCTFSAFVQLIYAYLCMRTQLSFKKDVFFKLTYIIFWS